jgi:hypothetical protein
MNREGLHLGDFAKFFLEARTECITVSVHEGTAERNLNSARSQCLLAYVGCRYHSTSDGLYDPSLSDLLQSQAITEEKKRT